MNAQFGFVLKVLILSAAIATGIKYWAPLLNIPASDSLALIVVLLPSLIMAIVLAWRAQQSSLSKPSKF
jgi:hypothetical protein